MGVATHLVLQHRRDAHKPQDGKVSKNKSYFVIPFQGDDGRWRFTTQCQDSIDNLSAVCAPVDVVAKKHDRVLRR